MINMIEIVSVLGVFVCFGIGLWKLANVADRIEKRMDILERKYKTENQRMWKQLNHLYTVKQKIHEATKAKGREDA